MWNFQPALLSFLASRSTLKGAVRMRSQSNTMRAAGRMEALPRQNRKVLVVDDDEAIHHYFRYCFSADLDLHFAFPADEALDLADRHRFPLVLLDLKMPGKSGMEMLPALRRRSTLQKAIILTGQPRHRRTRRGRTRCARPCRGSPRQRSRPCERPEGRQGLTKCLPGPARLVCSFPGAPGSIRMSQEAIIFGIGETNT